MKKFLASILTVASLACIVLMIYFMLGVGPLGAALQAAALPIAGALVTAFAAGSGRGSGPGCAASAPPGGRTVPGRSGKRPG